MAKLTLPEQLEDWKVLSPVSENGNYPTFSVVKTDSNGSNTNAVLTYVSFEGDSYNSDNIDLVNEEAAFVKSVIKLRGTSNYLDAVADNDPANSRISLFLLTTDAVPVAQALAGKTLGDAEIVDFGLQVSEILEKLEQNNILHGNIKPENIFVNADGRYVLGGFTAFEGTAEDPAYLAPEMQQGKQPDYTTDIYSLGLIMYTMVNGGKLPFESETADRADAVRRRLTASAVPAPAGGSEKLKSVIVIACQPDNKNRWKNAGNIKNALSAIKAELPAPVPQTPAAPEKTEFESNVFEEYAFDDVSQTAAPKPQAEPQPELSMAKGAALAASAAMMQQPDSIFADEPKTGTPENAPVADDAQTDINALANEPEITGNVFDDYEAHTRVFNLRDVKKAGGKDDYGDFFEKNTAKNDADGKAAAPAAGASAAAQPQTQKTDDYEGYIPYDNEYREPSRYSKKFIIGIVAIIVAALAALTAFGVYAWQNGFLPFGGGKNEDTTAAPATQPSTTAPAQTTVAPTTAPAETTEPETTAEPTTEAPSYPAEAYPENVVGYFFDYATEVLKAQGLEVTYEYSTSTEYDEGFVISMSPDSGTLMQRGSTVTLVISSGRVGGSETTATEATGSYAYNSESYGGEASVSDTTAAVYY